MYGAFHTKMKPTNDYKHLGVSYKHNKLRTCRWLIMFITYTFVSFMFLTIELNHGDYLKL